MRTCLPEAYSDLAKMKLNINFGKDPCGLNTEDCLEDDLYERLQTQCQ